MGNLKFFVESPDDLNFIKQYSNRILGTDLTERDFTILGSWSGYKTGGIASPEFEINTNNGDINVLIVDSDNDFKQRQQEIIVDIAKLGLKANLFLFPNNNQPGCLENLLTNIAVDRKLIDCFEKYEFCVQDYNKPLLKSKIYTYLDTLMYPFTPKTKNEDLRLVRNCDFTKEDHWNLLHPYLDNLNQFLVSLL